MTFVALGGHRTRPERDRPVERVPEQLAMLAKACNASSKLKRNIRSGSLPKAVSYRLGALESRHPLRLLQVAWTH